MTRGGVLRRTARAWLVMPGLHTGHRRHARPFRRCHARATARPFLLSLFALSLLGCTEGFVPSEHEIADGAPVHIVPSRFTLTAGDDLMLRIHSAADDALVFNACSRLLEVQTDARWRQVEEDRTCPLPGMQLPSGGEVDVLVTLPAHLDAGDYRVRLTFSDSRRSGEQSQVSAPFRVLERPTE